MYVTKMRFIIILAFATASIIPALCDNKHEKLKEDHRKCVSETGIDEELSKKPLQGEFPEDEVFKEFFFCMAKKIGLVNDAGEIQEDIVLKRVSKDITDPDAAKEVTKKCASYEGSPVEVAYNLSVCLYENSPSPLFHTQ